MESNAEIDGLKAELSALRAENGRLNKSYDSLYKSAEWHRGRAEAKLARLADALKYFAEDDCDECDNPALNIAPTEECQGSRCRAQRALRETEGPAALKSEAE